jgi:hypothetical protein
MHGHRVLACGVQLKQKRGERFKEHEQGGLSRRLEPQTPGMKRSSRLELFHPSLKGYPSVAITPPHWLYSQRFAGFSKRVAVSKPRPCRLSRFPQAGLSSGVNTRSADDEVTGHGCATGQVSR